jgi:hypothetical protein
MNPMITTSVEIKVNDDGTCLPQCQLSINDKKVIGCVFDLCTRRQGMRPMDIGLRSIGFSGDEQIPDPTKCPGSGTYTVIIDQ